MSITKKDLVKYVAKESGFTQKDVEDVIDLTLETIQKMVCEEDVKLTNFGIFYTSERAAREGRNPRTGEVMQIGATKTIGFKPAKQFKEVVKNEK